ncbi:hypothetical protein OIU78_014726 [Salix suchowensis]|jgi:hypothetical protein|nr:hypothetical protein OIU78_014726 [Salix suchowensis]
MGLTLYLEIKRGKIACHKSEARSGTLLREGRLVSRASRDEAFWRSQVNFGPPNPATDEKALWSKGKRVRCHTPGLPKVPRGRARRSRATTRERIPHRQGGRRRPSRGTSRPTGKIGETWEGNPARLRVRGSIVPAAPQTSYSTFFKAGGRDLFSAMEKKRSRFDSAQPNDTSNTNDLRRVARSLR